MRSRHRIVELDFLRVVAMILVLLGHLPSYFPGHLLLDWIYYAFTSSGVGLFVLISGYTLTHRYAYREDFHPLRFLGRRLARVYALYLPALVLFVVEFDCLGIYHKFDLSPFLPNMLVHIFAGQALLFPWAGQIFTLWFIGMIVFFYVCFGFIILGRTKYEVVAAIALTVAILLVYRCVLGVVDLRVLLYYPVFLLGMFLRHHKILSPQEVDDRLGISALALWIMAYLVFKEVGLAAVRNGRCDGQAFGCLLSWALMLVCVVSGTIFFVWLSSRVVKRMSEGVRQMILRMSVAAYAVYLFHRPVLAAIWWFGERVIRLGFPVKVGVFPVIIGGLFVVGYWIQQGANWVAEKQVGRLWKS